MLFRSNVLPSWTTVFCCCLLFGAADVARAQTDGDDILLMIPAMIAKAKQRNTTVSPPTSPTPNPSPTPVPPVPPRPGGLTDLESELLAAHNQARSTSRRCGGTFRSAVPSLRWNGRLARAAQVHSSDMNRTGVFEHEGSDGSSASQRATRQGYVWGAIGENIASGYPTVRSVVDALLRSTGHCNNIMGSRYLDFGAAKVGRYWTMVFARPR